MTSRMWRNGSREMRAVARALQLSARPQSTGALALLPEVVVSGLRQRTLLGTGASVGRISFRMNMTSPGFARPSWRRASASIVVGSSFNVAFPHEAARVLLFEGGDTCFFDVCLLPGTHRDEESLLANQRVRRQHDRHEQERRVQQPPATRDGGTGAGFRRRSGSGSRLSAGCRHEREDARLETALAWGVLCTILFEPRLRGS